MAQNEIAQQIMDRLCNDRLRLPAAPEVIIHVNSLINDDSKGMSDIAEAIQKHQTLAARLLQVVNSAALRPMRPVDTIVEALTILGISLVRNLTISLAIRDMFRSTNPELNARLQRIWQHSIQVGLLSNLLITRLNDRRYDPQIAMTIGILHEIGALPVIDFFDATKCCTDELGEVLEAMTPAISIHLLERWNLSASFVSAIRGDDGVYGDTLRYVHCFLNNQEFPKASIPITLEQLHDTVNENSTQYDELVSILA